MNQSGKQKVNEEKVEEQKPSLLSPEAIGMLFFAGLIDGLEFLFNLIPLRGLPEVLSFVLDLVALIVIGFWMLMRTGGITAPGKAVSRLADPLITEIMVTDSRPPVTDLTTLSGKLRIIPVKPFLENLVRVDMADPNFNPWQNPQFSSIVCR